MHTTEDLANLAKTIMTERGLEPEFPKEAIEQASQANAPASVPKDSVDLRAQLWCSIDNDNSLDLDQLTYAEKGSDGKATLWIAVADVDALIAKGSPVDAHAQTNTTSVYTPGRIFSMLPEKFSTNLTSLNEKEDRVAVVVKIVLAPSGDIESSSLQSALVHNYAKLTYNSVGPWLEGSTTTPDKVKQIPGLEDCLKVQHEAAQLLRQRRHEGGALTLETDETEVKVDDGKLSIQPTTHNFAHQLIEEFMIAANRSMAQYLIKGNIPSLRRVVRIPKYWRRIVEVARSYGVQLPDDPDSKALDSFLVERKKADPNNFAELSLTIIKLMGRGEYIIENADDDPVGHFGLALSDYTHSTAPNRRFPDLISQRQFKASLREEKDPYTLQELKWLATHCTEQEDAATKVERQINKCAAAMLLSSHIGDTFRGIVTGVNEKGTWVRVFQPAVEGKIVRGYKHLKVGDKVSVKLLSVDIEKGFIDFAAT